MKAGIFTSILLVIVTSTATLAQEDHSFFSGPLQLDLCTKYGILYGLPMQSSIRSERETMHELEIDVVKGHAVLSAFTSVDMPLQNNNWELGVLLGWNWHLNHSVFEIKGGLFGMNGYLISEGLDHSLEETTYKCIGEIIDCSYRYEVKDHYYVGFGVPLTLTRYFFNTGVNMSLGIRILE